MSDLDEKKFSFTAEEINLEALVNSLRLSIDDEKNPRPENTGQGKGN